MPFERVFLGWGGPFLELAAVHLCGIYRRAELLDMRGVLLVFPGARASRRFIEILVRTAEDQDFSLIPPICVTSGALPEVLYTPHAKICSPIQQHLAWTTAILAAQSTDRNLLFPKTRDWSNFTELLAAATRLDQLLSELSTIPLTFAEAAEAVERSAFGIDESRWRGLSALHDCYLDVLSKNSLTDLHSARKIAIERGNFSTDKQVYLMSCADLHPVTKRILSAIKGTTYSLVHAPLDCKELFDEAGCVNPAAWQELEISVGMDQIKLADTPGAQADAVISVISANAGSYNTEQVSIGVCDNEIAPYLNERFADSEMRIHQPAGVLLRDTTPCTLLKAVAAYLSSANLFDLGTLLRHQDMLHWLEITVYQDGTKGLENSLDRYVLKHFQEKLRTKSELLESSEGALLKQFVTALDPLLALFHGRERPLTEWGGVILSLLRTIYIPLLPTLTTAKRRSTAESCMALCEVISQWHDSANIYSINTTAHAAIETLLAMLGSRSIAPEPSQGAVECLGWLEISLDDAPLAILAGFNEGHVPESVNADEFLPNSLRAYLGISSNEKRYARDAFLLTSILKSKRSVYITVGKRSADDSPLAPSRLLLACRGDELARRIRRLYSDFISLDTKRTGFNGSTRGFPTPPSPLPLALSPSSASVTGLRSYLSCPYRYYLRHILRLDSITDEIYELDAETFGSIGHLVLNFFANSPAAQSTDAEAINLFLARTLRAVCEERFGENILPALNIQLHNLEMRLAEFAKWQAEWRNEGWEIKHSERIFPDDVCSISVSGSLMQLNARVDRFDYNSRLDEWAIIDYKISDKIAKVEPYHRRAGSWVDLQLPAYRFLALKEGFPKNLRLGFISLCSNLGEIGADWANWSDSLYDEATSKILEVLQAIRQQKFWPPATKVRFDDDFAMLCGTGQFLEGYEEVA